VIESCSHGVPCVGTEVAWQGIALPERLAHLSGTMVTFADRLLKTYNTASVQTNRDLMEAHAAWRGNGDSISQVIPRLMST
jgi:hypothetical protein